MGLEAATYIHQLNPSNPVGAVDPKAQGDDHLRMIKSTLQATFPGITGPITVTQTQINNAAGSGLIGFAIPSVPVTISAPAAGAANTALRSDARLQLDQAILPTWTGEHKFSGVLTSAAYTSVNGISLSLSGGNDPVVWSRNAAAAANQKNTALFFNAGSIDLLLYDDAGGAQRSVFQATRVGNAVNTLNFGNATNNPTYNFLGTGNNNLGNPYTPGQYNFAGGVAGFMEFVNRSAGALGVRVYCGALGTAPLFQVSATACIQVVDAAVGGPSYSYAGEPTTGEYRIAAGRIGYSILGTQVYEFKSAATGGALVTDYGGTLQTVGFRNIPQNIQNANYTAVLSDSAKHVLHGNGAGAGHTHTIPANASVAYDIGTTITFINRDSNVVSIAITTDTLILANSVLTGTRTLAQNGIATAIKVAATTWMISGPGVS